MHAELQSLWALLDDNKKEIDEVISMGFAATDSAVGQSYTNVVSDENPNSDKVK